MGWEILERTWDQRYPTPWREHGTRDTLNPPVNRLTDACENIIFPQLRWRAVISWRLGFLYINFTDNRYGNCILCTKLQWNIKVSEIRTALQAGREREKWHWHLLIPSVPGNRGTSSGVSFRHGRCTRNLSHGFDLVHRMIPSLWFGPLSNPKKKSWFEKYVETVISRNKKRSVSPLF